MNYAPVTAVGLGILTLLVSITGSFGGPAASSIQSDSAKDRAKWRLATLSAAREILDELNPPALLGLEERAILIEKLNHAMREDLQSHASRPASQRLCADIAVRMRRERLDRRFQAVLAHANEQSPIPILWTDVTFHLGADWSNAVEKTMQSFANTEQLLLFKDARDRAVGLLRQELEQQRRFPAENEVNDLLDSLLANHPGALHLSGEDDTQLQQKLMALVNPAPNACFEELKHTLNEQTRRIAGEIHRQYERQLTCLDKTAAKNIPDDRRQASALSAVLLNTLESDLAVERAKPVTLDVNGKPVPVYPVLTPIRNSVPARAAQLETERLAAFLAQSPILSIQSDSLAEAIRAEPESHYTLADSETVFRKLLASSLIEKTVKAYASGSTPPVAADYFATLLSTNSTLSNAFDARFSRELQASLVEARQVVCDEQFKKSFLAFDRKALLSPEALLALQDSGGEVLTTLPEALKLFDIPMRNADLVLKETVDRVLALANRKAREGYDVLTAQMALVRKLEQERIDKLRQEVTARRPYKEIRAEWQTALERAWTADSRAQTTPYKEVLDLTLANLNKTVRQLYDSIQESPGTPTVATPSEARPNSETEQGRIKELRQDAAKPEEQNPEPPKEIKPPDPKTSPKAGGSEGAANTVLSRSPVDRRNEPHGILLLTGTAEGLSMARLVNPAGLVFCSVSFNPGKPRDAATDIFEAMKPHLKALWSDTIQEWQKEHRGLGFLKRRTPPKLNLFIVIESEDVRHRMSLQLRQQIEEALTEWGKGSEKSTPEVELDWKVGLTFDQPPYKP